MRYLLDTHTFLWAIADPDKLSEKSFTIIEDRENTIFVSAISFWEISLKYALGKIKLIGLEPGDLLMQAKALGFDLLPLLPSEAADHHKLMASFHKDPFDRMLIWQAIQQKIILISKDENVAKYTSVGLKVIW